MNFLYEYLGIPFGIILSFFYNTVALENYAFAIILLTLFARILMVPTSISQQKGMAKTQRMQSKLRKIQTKYAGNQQKIQEETTALYQREGYNPMGAGCAPMFVQFLLLFGLIGAIYYPLSHSFGIPEEHIAELAAALKQITIEGVNTSKISEFQQELYIIGYIDQIKEIVTGEELKNSIKIIEGINFELFGLSLGDIPSSHKTPHVSWLIPVLSFLSSMATGLYSQMKQKKSNPAAANNAMMGCMTFGMPLMSLIWVINFPIGIGVYWIASSVFGFISTVIIGHIYSPKKVMAKLMVEETIERRSKENSIKNAVEIKNKKN